MCRSPTRQLSATAANPVNLVTTITTTPSGPATRSTSATSSPTWSTRARRSRGRGRRQLQLVRPLPASGTRGRGRRRRLLRRRRRPAAAGRTDAALGDPGRHQRHGQRGSTWTPAPASTANHGRRQLRPRPVQQLLPAAGLARRDHRQLHRQRRDHCHRRHRRRISARSIHPRHADRRPDPFYTGGPNPAPGPDHATGTTDYCPTDQ